MVGCHEGSRGGAPIKRGDKVSSEPWCRPDGKGVAARSRQRKDDEASGKPGIYE